VLVTGAPRSGTTWLARELARSPGAAMPGKEPMNPRAGQFALAGTVSGWVELTDPTQRQLRVLRRCYAGRELRTFSRYGVRQPLAPLPWTRTVVKDPFALLSVPMIAERVGAVPVVVYRHPGAVLASYRRMGWRANVEELRRLPGGTADGPGAHRSAPPADDVDAMIEFWTGLHDRVLRWLSVVPGIVLVSHAELSLGGAAAVDVVRRACSLRPLAAADQHDAEGKDPAAPPSTGVGDETLDPTRLHRFERRPDEVATGWRRRLSTDETARIESGSAATWDALEAQRLRVL
jgi:hypothetical protein